MSVYDDADRSGFTTRPKLIDPRWEYTPDFAKGMSPDLRLRTLDAMAEIKLHERVFDADLADEVFRDMRGWCERKGGRGDAELYFPIRVEAIGSELGFRSYPALAKSVSGIVPGTDFSLRPRRLPSPVAFCVGAMVGRGLVGAFLMVQVNYYPNGFSGLHAHVDGVSDGRVNVTVLTLGAPRKIEYWGLTSEDDPIAKPLGATLTPVGGDAMVSPVTISKTLAHRVAPVGPTRDARIVVTVVNNPSHDGSVMNPLKWCVFAPDQSELVPVGFKYFDTAREATLAAAKWMRTVDASLIVGLATKYCVPIWTAMAHVLAEKEPGDYGSAPAEIVDRDDLSMEYTIIKGQQSAAEDDEELLRLCEQRCEIVRGLP